MLSKIHATMKRDEAGQALVLGAATLIVLALSVLVTIQLGHVIQKRIAVQNAADNSAFSVAAVVARSLNAIAWMNRTIVSHYVSMMALQSIVSALNGLQALMGLSSDMLQSIASALCIIKRIADACCAACGAIPFAGAALAAAACTTANLLQPLYEAVQAGANGLRAAADGMAEGVDFFDMLVGPAVMALSKLNRSGMFVAQKAMKQMTLAALGSIAAATSFQKRVIQETVAGGNVRGSTATAYNAAMGALNAAVSYRAMFDANGSETLPDTSPGEPDDDAGRKPAARIMAQIANATRTGAGKTTWESRRNLDGESILSTVAKFLDFKYEGSTRLVAPMDEGTFSEESGNAEAASGPATGDCTARSQRCEQAKQECRDEHAEYEAADADADFKEARCRQSTSACSACSNPDCQACKDKSQSCHDASSARDDSNRERDEAANSCEATKRPCEQANNCTASISEQSSDNGKRNYVFMSGGSSSSWSRGNALASAEFVKAFGALAWVSGGGTGKYVGIQASPLPDQSFHCVYGKGTGEGSCDGGKGRRKFEVPSCPWYAWSCPVVCKKEGHRHKFDGMSPYVSFEIEDEPAKLFNQPDYWGLVNLSPRDARFPPDTAFGFDGRGSFQLQDFGNGGEVGKLSKLDKPGLSTSFGEGLNGWARSQVYYHRPGFWAEPPNLFTPYWRAKLAPVGPKFGELMGSFGGSPFGGQLQELATQTMTH